MDLFESSQWHATPGLQSTLPRKPGAATSTYNRHKQSEAPVIQRDGQVLRWARPRSTQALCAEAVRICCTIAHQAFFQNIPALSGFLSDQIGKQGEIDILEY